MSKFGNIVINTVLCIIAIPALFLAGIQVVSWLISLLPGDNDLGPLGGLLSGFFGIFVGALGICFFYLARRKSEKRQRQLLFGEDED